MYNSYRRKLISLNLPPASSRRCVSLSCCSRAQSGLTMRSRARRDLGKLIASIVSAVIGTRVPNQRLAVAASTRSCVRARQSRISYVHVSDGLITIRTAVLPARFPRQLGPANVPEVPGMTATAVEIRDPPSARSATRGRERLQLSSTKFSIPRFRKQQPSPFVPPFVFLLPVLVSRSSVRLFRSRGKNYRIIILFCKLV